MTKKIFKNILAVSVAVLILCVLGISYVLYGYFGEIITDELRSNTRLIAQGLEENPEFLNDLEYTEDRVTLIDEDGNVLFDNRADWGTMENHSQRAEIQEAMEKGEGYDVRYSDTLAVKTIYYAKALPDGSVIRVAQDQSVVMLLLRGVVGPVVVILALVLLITAFLSRVISKRIVTPINNMDLENQEAEEPYPELAPLMTKIRQQNRHIQKLMAELERKQNEFITITENMQEGFLLMDQNMEILSHNTAAIRLLGDGETNPPHRAFALNRSKGFRTAAEEALGGKNSQQPLEVGDRQYQIIANPVREQEKVVGAVVIIMDVTEKEQRDRLRREFTSNVSHELKTPLTTIYGVSDMMAEGMVKPADVKTFGTNIKEESGRMIQLIDDIIKLSRLDEEGAPEELMEVDLYSIAEETLERLAPRAEAKGVKTHLKGDHITIQGVPSLCSEILYNLCDNAMKYNREGGAVTVRIRREREGVELSVEDTGIGIPQEYRERIFERFFRVDKSHSQEVDGTGLGLSIVKHAVARMGGTIQVDSMEGAGTKITVTFPVEG